MKTASGESSTTPPRSKMTASTDMSAWVAHLGPKLNRQGLARYWSSSHLRPTRSRRSHPLRPRLPRSAACASTEPSGHGAATCSVQTLHSQPKPGPGIAWPQLAGRSCRQRQPTARSLAASNPSVGDGVHRCSRHWQRAARSAQRAARPHSLPSGSAPLECFAR
jgi:hypothetical protein